MNEPKTRSFRFALVAAALASSTAIASAAAEAIPTFHSVGLYWTPPSNPGSDGCQVRFRKSGESGW